LERIVTTKPDETAKVLRAWEKSAPGYDKQIAFLERVWFGGGRQWLGAREHVAIFVGFEVAVPHLKPAWW
jgi:hypothetical protein